MSDNSSYLGNRLLKRAGTKQSYTKEEVAEFIKCKKDPIYFAEKYMKIVHVDKGLVPFHMYDYQKKYMTKLEKNRFVICKMGRQLGKTTTITAKLLHILIFSQNKTIGILANKASTSMEILGRIQLAYQYLPKFLQQGVKEFNKGSFELENGSRILAFATSSSAVRGYSFNTIYVDEAAHIPPNIWEDFWRSVYPTISSGRETRVYLTSTPLGLNHFYKMWVDAEEKRSQFVPYEVLWNQHPDRDEAWRKETISNTSEEQFRQEHDCAFLGSSHTLIDPSKIQSMPFSTPIHVKDGLTVYEQPKKRHTYVLCSDVSDGIGIDYSTGIVIDITEMPYKVVAVYRDNEVSTLILPSILHKMAIDYNQAAILCEVNRNESVARTIYYDLEYEGLLMVTTRGRKGQCISSGFGNNTRYGVLTTASVKNLGCSILKELVESDRLIVPDHNIIQEFSTFSRNKNTYEAEPGCHDDLVMTLVIFAWMTRQETFQEVTNMDLRIEMHEKTIKEIEEELTPFGWIVDGNEIDDDDWGPNVTDVVRWF